MGFTVLAPTPPLSLLVDTIWDWDMPRQPHHYERILPSACSQLVVNLAEDETRVYDDMLGCRRFAGAAFDAPSHRSFVIDTAEQVSVMGVVFKPGGAAPLLRERMDLLCNDHVDLDALAGGAMHSRQLLRGLRQRLLDADGATSRLQVMQAWLLRQAGTAQPDAAVAHALRMFDDMMFDGRPQVQRIGTIAAHCRLSPRRFGALFREQVGMSPKRYARLQRFRRLVAQAHQGPSVDWAGLAADCGFHDQPHLVHEFRAFSGLTPTAWLAMRGPHANHIPMG